MTGKKMDGKNIPFAPLRDIKKAIKDGFIFYGPHWHG
jgi:hypothetical protein